MLGSHAQGVVPGIVEALRVAELTPLRSKYKKIQALHSALVLSFDPPKSLVCLPGRARVSSVTPGGHLGTLGPWPVRSPESGSLSHPACCGSGV